jgi:diadenosine tetraphosphate (Ap4A) HIT family hydrolase
MEGCLACDLASGKQDLPGGRIFQTKYWVVDHCVGPLGVGTLIVRPFRHCLHVWELTEVEAQELGPLLHKMTSLIKELLKPDQVYVCLWSHAGWTPVHMHFVLQPSWDNLKEKYARPGPFFQVDLFHQAEAPPREEVEAFAEQARRLLGASPSTD